MNRLVDCSTTCRQRNSDAKLTLTLMARRSEKLKPFWLSITEKEKLPQLDFLAGALLSRQTSREYRRALQRAQRMPSRKVVPFFGVFIRDLKSTLNQHPSVIVVTSNDDAIPIIQVSGIAMSAALGWGFPPACRHTARLLILSLKFKRQSTLNVLFSLLHGPTLVTHGLKLALFSIADKSRTGRPTDRHKRRAFHAASLTVSSNCRP